MLGFGFWELILIFFLLFILFGPKELPDLARTLLRMVNELKTTFQRWEQEWKLDSKKTNTSSPPDSSKNEQ